MWGSLPSVRDKCSHRCHPAHSEILLLLWLTLGPKCRLLTGSRWCPGRVWSPGGSMGGWGHSARPLSPEVTPGWVPCSDCRELLQPASLPLPHPCSLPLLTFLPAHIILRHVTSNKVVLKVFFFTPITNLLYWRLSSTRLVWKGGTEGFDGTSFLGDEKEAIFFVFRKRER